MRLRKLMALALLLACIGGKSVAQTAPYEPSAENLRSRAEFADMKFGIFLHWGIYSMFGQGEWYMTNAGINRDEYAKAAHGFFPSRFNAKEWVTAFKQAGAKYIWVT